MTTTAGRSAGAPAAFDDPEARRRTSPRADCTADGAGGLGFDVTVPSGGGARHRDGVVLLRLRGSDPEKEVRLPLAPSGAGRLRAVLPGTVPLAEGRWDAYLVLGEAPPRRLLPGCDDLRAIVCRVPRGKRTWLGVRIPYTTVYGNLTVHAWLRWPHAEAGDIWFRDGGMVLHGRLHGAALTASARLEARPRGAERSQPPVLGPVASRDGYGFTARLAYGELARRAAAARNWDLWLRPGGDAAAVRIARLLDDVHDKRQVMRYPPRPAGAAEGAEDGAELWARPHYTGDNDLSVRLEKAPGRLPRSP